MAAEARSLAELAERFEDSSSDSEAAVDEPRARSGAAGTEASDAGLAALLGGGRSWRDGEAKAQAQWESLLSRVDGKGAEIKGDVRSAAGSSAPEAVPSGAELAAQLFGMRISGGAGDASAAADAAYAEDDGAEDEEAMDSGASSEEELGVASALQWADFADDLAARGRRAAGAAAANSASLAAALQRPNAHGGALQRSARVDAGGAGAVQRLASRFSAAKMGGGKAGAGGVGGGAARRGSGKARDRSDRATVEQVLDPRTRMVLFKMLNRGLFSEINGCVSTGKEANVYHALPGASAATAQRLGVRRPAKEAGGIAAANGAARAVAGGGGGGGADDGGGGGGCADDGAASSGIAAAAAAAAAAGAPLHKPVRFDEEDTPLPEDTSGISAPSDELAIKVYKTAILVFKDRGRYVVGDARFARYCKSNPRKMVKAWAEKEARNLARLRAAGVRAPAPLQLRLHVLVMEFIGRDGVAAPRLRDAGLGPVRTRAAYRELVVAMWRMHRFARLVHADLSEYNVLFHDDELWIIDVSQAVDLDHPRALDFLREDCLHVNDYFRKRGVPTLTVKELFDLIVDPLLETEAALDDALDRLTAVAAARPVSHSARPEAASADAVWAQSYIPRRLDEVAFPERDHARLQEGTDVEGIYFQDLAGMAKDMGGVRTQPLALIDGGIRANGEGGRGDGDGAEEAPALVALDDAFEDAPQKSRTASKEKKEKKEKRNKKVPEAAHEASTVATAAAERTVNEPLASAAGVAASEPPVSAPAEEGEKKKLKKKKKKKSDKEGDNEDTGVAGAEDGEDAGGKKKKKTTTKKAKAKKEEGAATGEEATAGEAAEKEATAGEAAEKEAAVDGAVDRARAVEAAVEVEIVEAIEAIEAVEEEGTIEAVEEEGTVERAEDLSEATEGLDASLLAAVASASGSEASDSEGSPLDSDEEREFVERKKMTKDEIRAARQENKKSVKAANAERRKTKLPKKEKKKKIAKAKGNKNKK